MSILLRLAYDGTEFHGWARQPPLRDGSEVRTVQGELERALGVLCRRPVATRGASRTDAGVHARGQIVAFERATTIPCSNVAIALSRMLPRDMAVRAAWEQVGEGGAPVDPRRLNDGKHYRYRLFLGAVRDPVQARWVWQLNTAIDLDRMREAAAHLCGTHDFSAFRSSMCQATTTVRTIHAVDIVLRQVASEPDAVDDARPVVDIHVRGTAFLHNMVRIIVGTLVEIGQGKGDGARIDALLEQGDRTRAGRTAPASGLTLVEVLWPGAPG